MFELRVRAESGQVHRTSLSEELNCSGGAMLTFIAPHDDDVALGCSLMIQHAKSSGLDCSILIVSDGSMGYGSPLGKDRLMKTRRAETEAAYSALGVNLANLIFLGFPDSDLHRHRGRSKVCSTDPRQIAGCAGIQNSLIYWLRQFRPSAVFLPNKQDPHPDHQVVRDEGAWAVGLSSGGIWQELGPGYPKPKRFEYLVYDPFVRPPTHMVMGETTDLEKKIKALEAWRSQGTMGGVLPRIRAGNAAEYFLQLPDRLEVEDYSTLFSL